MVERAVGSLVLLLVAGCASAGREGLCRSDLAPHPRSLGERVDSVAVSRSVAAVGSHEGDPGQARFPDAARVPGTVAYDSLGHRASASVLAERLPDPVADELERALEASARERGAPDELVDIVLVEDGRPAVRRAAAFRRCAPVLPRQPEMLRAVRRPSGGLDPRTRTVGLRIRVDEDGSVGDVQVEETSGDVEADLAMARPFRGLRYRPALVEGIPVRVWIRVPITFGGGA